MKGLLIDVKHGEVRKVKADTLKEYYRLIECRLIDIIPVSVGQAPFDIILDDEGLLSSDPIPSGVSDKGKHSLFGNLIICGACDDEGRETDLSEDDVETIKDSITWELIIDHKTVRSIPRLHFSWR